MQQHDQYFDRQAASSHSSQTYPRDTGSVPKFLFFLSLSLVGGGVNIPVTSLTPHVPSTPRPSSTSERSTNSSSAVSTFPMERFRLCRTVEGASDEERMGSWVDCLFRVDLRVGVEVDMARSQALLLGWASKDLSLE